jgi:tRNA threonylcarbamoyladenosine biosynthesis protein TsaE
MQKTFRKDELSEITKILFEEIQRRSSRERATVVALSGDLGAGKTTLTQALARELGITETVISPTFVIMKEYVLPGEPGGFSRLVHIDAYRLESAAELSRLGWQELVADPKALVLVEWPGKVPGAIPEDAVVVTLAHESEEVRQISF